MAKKTIRGAMSVKGIQSIVDQLEQYKVDFHRKVDLLCQRLADTGQTVALERISESPLGKTVVFRTEMQPRADGCKAILIASGQTKSNDYGTINTLMFVEFGAGIYFNLKGNPKAGEMGMGIGTFPGQIHAFEDGWYYWGEDNKWHYTHGTKATMPMYGAATAIRMQVSAIVKEVFG